MGGSRRGYMAIAKITCSSSVEGSERGKQAHCMRQVVAEGLREGGRSFSYKGFTLLMTMCTVGRCCVAEERVLTVSSFNFFLRDTSSLTAKRKEKEGGEVEEGGEGGSGRWKNNGLPCC